MIIKNINLYYDIIKHLPKVFSTLDNVVLSIFCFTESFSYKNDIISIFTRLKLIKYPFLVVI